MTLLERGCVIAHITLCTSQAYDCRDTPDHRAWRATAAGCLITDTAQVTMLRQFCCACFQTSRLRCGAQGRGSRSCTGHLRCHLMATAELHISWTFGNKMYLYSVWRQSWQFVTFCDPWPIIPSCIVKSDTNNMLYSWIALVADVFAEDQKLSKVILFFCTSNALSARCLCKPSLVDTCRLLQMEQVHYGASQIHGLICCAWQTRHFHHISSE